MTRPRTAMAWGLALALGLGGAGLTQGLSTPAHAMFLKDWGKRIRQGVRDLGRRIRGAASRVGHAVRGAVRRAGSVLRRTASRIRTGLRSAYDRARGAVQRVVGGAKRLVGRAGAAVKGALARIKRGFQAAAKGVKRAAAGALAKMRSLGSQLLAQAKRLGKAAAKTALHGPFYAYILANRAAYQRKAKPLTASEKSYLLARFPARLVNRARVLVRSGDTGFFNKSAGATTYGTDLIIVRAGHRSNSLLEHEMVHVCQYDRHGVKGFAYRYADQYVDGGFSYRNIAFEKQAYGFTGKPGPISKYLGYCSK